MKREEAKAEAEKIIQEIIPIIDPDFGKVIRKVVYEKTRKLAILQVKGIIKQIKLMYPHPRYGYEIDRYRSILTELERTK